MSGHNRTDRISANADDQFMPDTGERREITSQTNAMEAEIVQNSKKLRSKTEQLFAIADAKNLARAQRSAGTSPKHAGKTVQDHTKINAFKRFADSHGGGHTARRPALASRDDVRQAVRGVRASKDK